MIVSIFLSQQYHGSIDIEDILAPKNECSFKLNNINTGALKDLIRLLSEFKNVSVLVRTGTRPSHYTWLMFVLINLTII